MSYEFFLATNLPTKVHIHYRKNKFFINFEQEKKYITPFCGYLTQYLNCLAFFQFDFFLHQPYFYFCIIIHITLSLYTILSFFPKLYLFYDTQSQKKIVTLPTENFCQFCNSFVYLLQHTIQHFNLTIHIYNIDMSFFKSSLKALGFGGKDNAKDDYIYTAKDITNATTNRDSSNRQETQHNNHQSDIQPKEQHSQVAPAENKQPENTELSILPDTLLNKVVELINASFPDFVRNCIDIESEKKYIFDQLGEPFKNYVANLNATAQQRSEANVAATRKQLEDEMATLRRKTAELEEQKAEIKNAQLSAERQKRALNEKVHELDSRIVTLEAEKEQYELENKSLINKLKVSGVKQQEVDDAQEEINRLLGVIQEMRKNGTISPEIENQLAQKDASLQDAIQQLNDANATVERLNQEVTQFNTLKEQSDATILALNEDKEALQIAITNKNAEIDTLNNQISILSNQQVEYNQQLNELQNSIQDSSQLQASLAQKVAICNELETDKIRLQETINNKEQEYNELLQQLADMQQKENESLKASQEANDKLIEANENNALITNERDQARQMVDELRVIIEQQKEQIIQLQTSFDNISAQLTNSQHTQEINLSLSSEIEQLNIKLTNTSNELTLLQNQLLNAQSALEEKQEQLIEAQNNAENVHEKLKTTQQRLEQSESETSQLKEQNSELIKSVEMLEIAETKVAQLQQVTKEKETLTQLNNTLNEEKNALQERIYNLQDRIEEQKSNADSKQNQLQEYIDTLKEQLQEAQKTANSNTLDNSQELEKANNMIAALKKQRQELVSQTATLRSQNKSYENQIAALENKLNNTSDDTPTITFGDDPTDIGDAINWMMPVLPDSLEEEARRREEEERIRREEEEQERQAQKERLASREDSSSQMSLW